MRRVRRVGWGLAVVASVFAWGRVGEAFQRSGQVPAPMPDYSGRQSSGSQTHSPFDEQGIQVMEEKRAKSMNNERQRLLIRDADQLVQNAADLEARVLNDPQGAAREDEGRRAETIEKLAKSVKDRMRGMR